MPKILVSDELSPKGIAILQAAEGIEVDVKAGMPPEELIALIPDYHGLVIRSTTKVTDEVIAAAANMKVIGRAGIGIDNVALEAASTKGIIVMNTPGGNTITTAEHAIAMLMAMSRNIPQADHSMKEGKWEKKQFIGVEVFNKTLGVIGLGRVGSIVAQRALGLQMKVVTHDPYIARDVAEKIGAELVEFDDLLARSDYISLHAAKTKDTEGLIGAGEGVAASTKGIIVMNTPGGNTITTAEHAIAMLMAMSRNIPQADHSMKEGKWEKKQFIGVEVFNKTLGVIGLGRVGSIVAQRALGLQMKVVTHDPYIARDVAEKIGAELVEFDDLLARSDYISLHAAKTKDTEGLIGAGEFAKMKNGVFLINCARGGIVEEEALFEALESGKVAGAALDVFSIEPTLPDNPLVNHPRVICTPHLGASTGEAQENVAIAIAEQIVNFFTRGEVKNAVNTPSLDAEVVSLLGPYLNLAGRLGSFAAQYVDGGIKEVNIRYAGEEIARGTTPLTLYVLTGVLQTFMEEAVNTVNAPYLVKQRGIVVNESTTRATEDYTNLITVELVTDKGRGTVSGTIFGRKNPRIVRIDEVSLEAMPEGHILVFANRDTPGVIGRVGTILGNNEINIAGIQLGRTAPQEDAVAVLNVDQPVNESVIAELLALPNLYYAKTITL